MPSNSEDLFIILIKKIAERGLAHVLLFIWIAEIIMLIEELEECIYI